ncbi:polar amino acid transport system ATP-binding protein [Leucobacter exalbidus]|uniref:ABC-type polar-amino-acid transporter n=1 Tax=Leucobacter exalbidus TaxID=662960 RepID=A0A940PUK6_9MICO|nr:amino acid ABC transporter ATP-binding protein [Leucobacter exalbidus]MBP1326495.1 polar amino acid transport system ATP-binding protein [Leucobacter exalbidus]
MSQVTAVQPSSLLPMVAARNVQKSFGDNHVLKGIDLDIQRGGVVSLLGASGSGKSTFLRCINSLEKIDGGRIWVDGELVGYRAQNGKLYDLDEAALTKSRLRTGMVFQKFNLFAHMTVLENLIEAPMSVLKLSRRDAIERAQRLLERVGLTSHHAHYPNQLSGGQQQRVAIARALAMEPEVMLFDEPTSALDPELVGEVLDVMRGLADGGMTMIIVTHEIGFAREVCDQVAFLHDGQVVESGNPADVIGNPQHERTRNFLSKVL